MPTTLRATLRTLPTWLTHKRMLSLKATQFPWFPAKPLSLWLSAALHPFLAQEQARGAEGLNSEATRQEVGGCYEPFSHPRHLLNHFFRPRGRTPSKLPGQRLPPPLFACALEIGGHESNRKRVAALWVEEHPRRAPEPPLQLTRHLPQRLEPDQQRLPCRVQPFPKSVLRQPIQPHRLFIGFPPPFQGSLSARRHLLGDGVHPLSQWWRCASINRNDSSKSPNALFRSHTSTSSVPTDERESSNMHRGLLELQLARILPRSREETTH